MFTLRVQGGKSQTAAVLRDLPSRVPPVLPGSSADQGVEGVWGNHMRGKCGVVCGDGCTAWTIRCPTCGRRVSEHSLTLHSSPLTLFIPPPHGRCPRGTGTAPHARGLMFRVYMRRSHPPCPPTSCTGMPSHTSPLPHCVDDRCPRATGTAPLVTSAPNQYSRFPQPMPCLFHSHTVWTTGAQGRLALPQLQGADPHIQY